MFQLLGSMMHLRLDAATCTRMTLRRVLREVVVPRAWAAEIGFRDDPAPPTSFRPEAA